VTLDPLLQGDPAAMLGSARTIRFRAEKLAALAAQLQGHVDRTEFEGPAAWRMRAEMLDRRHRADKMAAKLNDLAALMARSAAWLEQAQRDEQIRLQPRFQP
jgi:hypothetical protein